MAKTQKRFVLAILTILAAVCMLFAACGGDGQATLKFEMNGAPAIESVTVDKGTEYELPTPEWTGHSFEGWFTEEDFSGSSVTSVTVEEDMTVYAKWEQLCEIKLELGGGTLAAGTTLYAAAGTNISQFMKDYVPTYADHQLGEWLVGTAPLSADATLTAAGITLTAHYKVAYSVELHLQDLEQSSYVKQENDYIGYEYVTGTAFAPDSPLEGFVKAENAGNTAAKALTENVADNKYVLYLDRKTVEVTLAPNYPASVPETVTAPAPEKFTTVYGKEMILPAQFSLTGYALIGWSALPEGEAQYSSDFISSRLFEGTYEDKTFTAENSVTLYAVWLQGCTDLFGTMGGSDYIFHLAEDAEDIYLLRGNVIFQGTYHVSQGSFEFETDDTDNTILGKLTGNGTFVYNNSRRAVTYTLYNYGTGANERIQIDLDNTNGITYRDRSLIVFTSTSKGTYTVDEDGYYHVTYTEGDLEGQSFVYLLSSQAGYFMVRDEVAYGWGKVRRGAVNEDGEQVYYKTDIYSLEFDGFFVATYLNSDQTKTTYYYFRDEEDENKIVLVNPSYNIPVMEAEIQVDLYPTTYIFYFSQYDVTYRNGNGDLLKLDGKYNATLANASGTSNVNGTYQLYSSELGTLLRFRETSGTVHLYVLTTATEEQKDDNGETTQVTLYNFSEIPVNYAEYNFTENGSVFYAPMIVINDDLGVENSASIYNYVSRSYVKVLTGTYTYDETKKVYTFTTKKALLETSPFGTEFDIAKIETLTFSTTVMIGSSSEIYSVFYLRSMKLKDAEEPTQYEKTYRAAAGGSDTLDVSGGYAVYTHGDETTEGALSTNKQTGITALSSADGTTVIFFRLNEENSTFTVLDGLLSSYHYAYTGGGVYTEILTFHGDGTATYVIEPMAESGQGAAPEEEWQTHEGKYVRTGDTTPFGFYIYTFTADDDETVTFKFILVPVSSSTVYFFKEDTSDIALAGTYTDGEATLVIDGYRSYAYYSATGEEADAIQGEYSISADGKSVRLSTSSRYYYFDITADDGDNKTFTKRDDAYGTYLRAENRSLSSVIFTFDGYGKLTVSEIVSSEGDDGQSTTETKTIDENGHYELKDNGLCILYYTVAKEGGGADNVTLKGYLGAVVSGLESIPVFFCSLEKVASSYVNGTDWSVLELNDHGGAVQYDNKGNAVTGQYVIITDTMLYFSQDDGSDARIYTYDREKGTMQPVNNSETAYYSENFDALLFTRYGFMIMNGTTLYYYSVDSKENVTLYHQEPTNPEANEYGFVEIDDFGILVEDEKEYGGKTYYHNYDFMLTFSRSAADGNDKKYPVPTDQGSLNLKDLHFTPTGSAEFTDTSATIRLDGLDRLLTCTVMRVEDETEEGKYHLYIDLESFLYEIEVSYHGDNADATYKVLSMRHEVVLQDAVYLSTYGMYLMFGMSVPNNFGTITMTTVYDEAGKAGTPKATGRFGAIMEEAGLVDSKGNSVSFEDLPYTYANGTYSVTIEGKDGQKYGLHFALDTTYYQYLGIRGYGIMAFTRFETLTDKASGIDVTVERVIFTESANVSLGAYNGVTLSKDGENIPYDARYSSEGKIYYFSRTMEEIEEPAPTDPAAPSDDTTDDTEEQKEPKILSTKLYIIEITEKAQQDEEHSDSIAELESAKVEVVDLTVAYCADGTRFVEYDATNHRVYTYFNGTGIYLFSDPEKYEYDAETGKYTLSLASGRQFSVTIDENGVATVTEIEQEE